MLISILDYFDGYSYPSRSVSIVDLYNAHIFAKVILEMLRPSSQVYVGRSFFAVFCQTLGMKTVS